MYFVHSVEAFAFKHLPLGENADLALLHCEFLISFAKRFITFCGSYPKCVETEPIKFENYIYWTYSSRLCQLTFRIWRSLTQVDCVIVNHLFHVSIFRVYFNIAKSEMRLKIVPKCIICSVYFLFWVFSSDLIKKRAWISLQRHEGNQSISNLFRCFSGQQSIQEKISWQSYSNDNPWFTTFLKAHKCSWFEMRNTF